MNLSFDPVWSWPVTLLACAVITGVVALGYPRRIAHLEKRRRRLLMALRIVLALLLLFWMLRPFLTFESKDEAGAVLYVLTDRTRSMMTPDETGGITRFSAMRKLLDDANDSLSEISESVEVRRRSFAQSLQPFDPELTEATGEITSFGNALEQLLQDAGSSRVAGVLLLSDARQAAAGSDDQDPLPLARLMGQRLTPIYGVTIGNDVASTSLDVAVSELDVARDVFVRNVVPIRIRVRALGVAGRDVPVRVLLEGPQPQPGVSGPVQPVPRSEQSRSVVIHKPATDSSDDFVDLSFVPERAGEFKLAVEAVPLPGEVRPANNRVETIITVRGGGIRVAYFDVLRDEPHWLNSITVSSRVQLDFQQVYGGQLATRNRFDESWFEPGNVDAFIIGDVPADVFGTDRLERMRRCCEQGAGLMMIGGIRNFAAGDYHRSPLANLLPVDMQASSEQLTGPVEMRPTPAGLNHYVMQVASPELNRRRWAELPPLSGATQLVVRQRSLGEILAETPSGTPLLIGQEIGRSRSLAFGGDTTWQWFVQRPDWGPDVFRRFWRQIIFWLTKKEQDSDAPVWVNVEPRDLLPGQTAELRFGANTTDGRPLSDAEWELEVTRPDGTTVAVAPGRSAAGGVAQFRETTAAGDYHVRATARLNGEPLGLATARFLVNRRDPELDNPAANPAFMQELAHLSGGDLLTPEEFLQRLQHWADDGLPGLLELRRRSRVNLWDNWYVLLLFAGLFTAEWFLRKKSGLV